MAIEIQEKFEIEAPTDRVWQFISTPELVVGCLPGASLAEVVDERNFLGRVKIKLGAVTAAYKGKIHFEDVDAERYVLVMIGEGKDPSGGTAKARITVQLSELESGATEMSTEATIDLTGKVMQVGAGMIKGVSHQLFQKFAKTAKERLEQEPAEASASDEATPSDASAAPAVPATAANDDDEALSVLPLLLSTLGAAIRNFFSRLFGGSKN
ncbi:MAG: SRPBCC family protein [Myxococcota bacterium]|jgi:carbon monoxide dehydrogenase subunit G|nr:SRPBCC family protein [Myxococcota bacterium]